MEKRRWSAKKALACIVFLLAVSGNVSADSIRGCGTVNEDSFLGDNLFSPGTCLTIGASDIVLDCAGYSITGDSTGYGINVSGESNVTIKNCHIKGFEYGIYLNSSSNNTIYNNLFNNTNNVVFEGTTYNNTWNTTKTLGTNIVGGPDLGGNFWAYPNGSGPSENCIDANWDGLCDSDYTLASGNVDYLPLSLNFDIVPPAYSNLTPSNGSFTNDVGQVISIVITDDGSDVNAGSLSMTVAGDYYETNSGKLDYDISSGLLTYNASDGEFNGGQTVYVVVNAEDNAGNQMEEVTWSFTVDIIPPIILITSPQNTTYNTSTIDLNVSADETIDTWWHNLNNAGNVTFAPNTTITGAGGLNSILVYANDTAGNLGSSSVYFTAFPVHNIDTNENFSTIQEAIDDSNTNAGHTIIVEAGTYNENVDVNKSVNLVGAGADVTIVNATNSSDYVFEVTADNVVIRGFTVKAGVIADSGIYVITDYNNISNNFIDSNSAGIEIGTYSDNNIINDNEISSRFYGISLRGDSNSLKDNVIYDTETGIILFSSDYNNLSGNKVKGTQKGILNVHSNNNTFTNNSIVENGYGVFIDSSFDVKVIHNNFSGNLEAGIFLSPEVSNCNRTLIQNNSISSGKYGIYLSEFTSFLMNRSSNNNEIVTNTISNHSIAGIVISNLSSNNTIYYNNFINNTQQAYDDGKNTWDNGYPSGGNYWSDYDESSEGCDDTNSDGFCDSPYDISGGNNQDRYPVTVQNGWLNVTPDTSPPLITITSPENKAYSATTIDLKVSSSDPDVNSESWRYEYNGINITFSPNTTFVASGGDGVKNITVWVSDDIGNWNSLVRYFTIDTASDGGTTKGVLITKIDAGSSGTAFFDIKDTGYISEIIVHAKQTVYIARLIAEALYGKPFSNMPDPEGLLLSYLRLTTSGISNSQLDRAEIKFQVPVSWLVDNDISQNSVLLVRYVQSPWEVVDTTYLVEDADYAYFTATTPGFSYFAITGARGSGYATKTRTRGDRTEPEGATPVTLPPVITTPPPSTPSPAPVPPPIAMNTIIRIVLIFAIAIAAVYHLILKKRQ